MIITSKTRISRPGTSPGPPASASALKIPKKIVSDLLEFRHKFSKIADFVQYEQCFFWNFKLESRLESWVLLSMVVEFDQYKIEIWNVLLEVKKIPTELLCGLGDVYWEAESIKWCLNSSRSLTIFFGIFEAEAEAGGPGEVPGLEILFVEVMITNFLKF